MERKEFNEVEHLTALSQEIIINIMRHMINLDSIYNLDNDKYAEFVCKLLLSVSSSIMYKLTKNKNGYEDMTTKFADNIKKTNEYIDVLFKNKG